MREKYKILHASYNNMILDKSSAIFNIYFVIIRYPLHLQKAQHVHGNILKLVKPSCRCDVRKHFLVAELWTFGWNGLSDTVVKSTCVASFKNNLGAVDLRRL